MLGFIAQAAGSCCRRKKGVTTWVTQGEGSGELAAPAANHLSRLRYVHVHVSYLVPLTVRYPDRIGRQWRPTLSPCPGGCPC
jgi:endo-1,4-beta-D-glucanase Y